MHRPSLKSYSRWVVKVGSALLTDDGRGLNAAFIALLAKQIAFLRQHNIDVILVSSGSVAAGVSQLGLGQRPTLINELQAAAAIGQASLVQQYEQAFQPYDVNVAQVLLTHADIANRERYLNARSTLMTLMRYGALAIINENDTVANEEICFGDNDSLGALVANLVGADLLVILTDQSGLYTADPRSHPDAKLLSCVAADDPTLIGMASGGSSVGRGGMITKVSAAQIANRSGAHTIIASGREQQVLMRLFNDEKIGTFLLAKDRLASRKQWMAGQMRVAGSFVLDEGAVSVVKSEGRSLLPVGVVSVNGEFTRGALVQCVDQSGNEIARGLSNYASSEADKIKGRNSESISDLLGYGGESELIHRDNLVLT